ncbi:hypothetical protein [Texcoconibacillus texcoconensis]|uniref:Uncharacterized protein n=1 Tax=Texcoconibacillus texcoconensis TaxID=1095777 RepID=A0A840QS32_9BACI|nr:hypothetical protein [Texcoconibacillus texcoconensis]MBB5174150.1 hypothetical protein [Texcoconibacillus texcoconensis]
MGGMSGPFADKYIRYILGWLVLGIFGIYYFGQTSMWLGLTSFLGAFIVTFGFDIVFRQIVKRKARKIVKQKPEALVDVLRHGQEKKGYLIFTRDYVLFVPVFGKVKTVIELDQIVRRQFDRSMVEIIARFPNRYRVFSFTVLFKGKLKELIDEKMGKSQSYKYEET